MLMGKNDCISRKALLDALPLFQPDQVGHPLNCGIAFARAQIEAAPLLDVAPVVHGRRIKDCEVVVCSECGEEHGWAEYRATYCEDCGARMDGDADG